MDLILFTKFLAGRNAREVAEAVKSLGLNGMDLVVRDGQCVNPDNAVCELPKVVKTWASQGLCVPVITADVADPDSEYVKSLYAACGDVGVPNVRMAYVNWTPEEGYWNGVDRVRGLLEGFEKLGERHSVRTLVHTHCDNMFGSNASGAMHLVKGFDPKHVGVFLDPGHILLDGEYVPMAIDIVRDYLAMVSVKTARYVRVNTPEGSKWQYDWCALSEGLVDWSIVWREFRRVGFSGPISFHSEHSNVTQPEDHIRLLAADIAHVKPML